MAQLVLGLAVIVMVVTGANVLIDLSETGRYLTGIGMVVTGGISATFCLYAVFVIEDAIKGE